MTKSKNSPGVKGHRFPPEITEYAVWLYSRFSLSLRHIEDRLAERGIIVSHETVRFWVGKFGQLYAKSIRRDRPVAGDKWREKRARAPTINLTIPAKHHAPPEGRQHLDTKAANDKTSEQNDFLQKTMAFQWITAFHLIPKSQKFNQMKESVKQSHKKSYNLE